MNTNHCRWGILGAAFIARKNWQAIRDAGNATLVAVASRDVERAAAFITECQSSAPHAVVPEAMGSYEALLARTDIDAVYIPLPTGLRKEWVIRAAQAGKHVLVEKPVGIHAADVAEIIAACDRHKVQFMDGVMFMHGRRLQHLRHVVDQDVGKVRHIASQFSFMSDAEFQRTNIRAHGALEPLGCLGDLGWYCLRFTLWAMNYAMPTHVMGRIHAETQQSADTPPVPLEFSGTLNFANGASASFYCSFTATNAEWAIVSGDNGLLQVSDFVLPFSGTQTRYSLTRSEFVLDRCQFDMHEGRSVHALDEPSSNAP
ncbi:MAG TPA: Gfo/Idh/MocA family oxidoreductase, partial [Prosthecobacter sp.]|nr:Gfo/Idh/MocA family oxidoreductase [Prosthecobacter sp.]